MAVFAAGDAAAEARAAGADHVGADDLVAQIEGGMLDFDVAIATPDLMAQVARLGRTLGPRGLMPNPKTGTVTTDVGRAVTEFKGGRVEYRTERQGANVHVPIGRASFDADALLANFRAVVDELQRVKPASAKGRYFKRISVSSTMGPGVKVDPNRLAAPGRRHRPAASLRPPQHDLLAADLWCASGRVTAPAPRRGGLLTWGSRPREPTRRSPCTSTAGRGREPRRASRGPRRSRSSTRCGSGCRRRSAALLTEYRGLKVGELADLRRQLRAAGGDYKIYKNTLVRFAVRDLGIDLSRSCSPARPPSPSSTATPRRWPRRSATTGAPTRTWWSRAACSARGRSPPTRPGPWPTCPSREVLLARLAGALAAPMQQFAGLLPGRCPATSPTGSRPCIDSRGGAPADEAAADETAAAERRRRRLAPPEEAPDRPTAEAAAAEPRPRHPPTADAPNLRPRHRPNAPTDTHRPTRRDDPEPTEPPAEEA